MYDAARKPLHYYMYVIFNVVVTIRTTCFIIE
jgi:hypothetical protein